MTLDALALLPPGCHVQGRRTLHIDLGEALAALGLDQTPETRVGAGQAPRLETIAREVANRAGLRLRRLP